MALQNTISADKTISVQEFIALRPSDEITYYNYSILQYYKGFDMFITNLLYDYEDELNDIAVILQLTEKEKSKYRFKPDLLAFDIYGSTECKFIIMMLNNIIDPKEFDFNRVKVIKPYELGTILNRMQAVNEEFMNNNRANLKADFKANEGNTIWIE